jgi:membrane protease YdiL (CAAX protease family)
LLKAADTRAGASWLAGQLARLRRAVHTIDVEAARERAEQPGYDRGPLIAFGVGALCLTLMEYLAGPRVLADVLRALHDALPDLLPPYQELRFSRWFQLLDLVFWVGTRALGFVLLPWIASRLWLTPRPDFGLSLPRRALSLRPYLLLFAAVLPLLVAVGLRPEFRTYYPFYRRAGESWFDFGVWELLYAFQFFCVEFFFRGFLLASTRRALGSHALLAAMVPYCMVHFTKPLLEVLGAIPAGLVLGLLALQTRSIWGGVLLHVAVALSMDVLALTQGRGLPTQLWPPG